ncbi:MAG: Type site-specific deoxyribonuclease [Ferruginibacter sp.]|nr:Type site-specific deoxyribonuclease [Ferruginibacter sp.]
MRTEKLTRKELIDIHLKKAGWDVNDSTQIAQEYGIAYKKNIAAEEQAVYGNQFCDYLLLGRDRKPIAVLEAKKTSKDAQLGKEQARQYAVNIQKETKGIVPFVLYSNGHETYFWDTENYPPRRIFGLPTLNDLERLQNLNESKKPLSVELINPKIAGRPYQIKAIRAVMEAIEQKKRKFLLVMATGTGKTRVCAALIDTLMRADWCNRVLFLVDRIALQDQALDTFREHLPNIPLWPKAGETRITTDRRIYVTTCPSMLNIIEQETPELSSHFFDLIVIDESHRSIYNIYQNIINYFDAITLGLTATPTDVIDHNTFHLFDCENELPTFAYSYEEAVSNIPPYLSDFKVLKLKTHFQLEGINRNTITVDDQKKLLLEGKEIEEINFEGKELEKTVTNVGTNALIVKEFMEECIKDENGVVPGKTIFFCISISHAREIQKIFDKLYPEYKGSLAEVIVSEDSRVHGKGGLLDQFVNNDMPRIAISVDMLDTGIDIRELVNLVFAKPVFSYTKFWQMIGRGTRLLEKDKLKNWCRFKDHFLIIDCWNNIEYFKISPKGKEAAQQIPLPVRLFRLYVEKARVSLQIQNSDALHNAIYQLKKLINLLPSDSVIVKENSGILSTIKDEYWDNCNADKCDYLDIKVSPILRSLSGVDFKAMRFEKDILEISIARLLNETDKSEVLIEALKERIEELPLNVLAVNKELNYIEKIQKNTFWIEATEERLNEIVEHLAPIMKYQQENNWGKQIRLDIKDRLLIKEFIEFGPQHERISTAKYKEILEQSVRELAESNSILQKIKNGKKITENEIHELEKILSEHAPYVTEELLKKVYDNRKASFIRFIKYILKIENLETFTDEVSIAFNNFISTHNNYTEQQIRFLELLQSFILEKGSIEKRDLVDVPFTHIHSQGILGLFNPKEINEIVLFTKKLVA